MIYFLPWSFIKKDPRPGFKGICLRDWGTKTSLMAGDQFEIDAILPGKEGIVVKLLKPAPGTGIRLRMIVLTDEMATFTFWAAPENYQPQPTPEPQGLGLFVKRLFRWLGWESSYP